MLVVVKIRSNATTPPFTATPLALQCWVEKDEHEKEEKEEQGEKEVVVEGGNTVRMSMNLKMRLSPIAASSSLPCRDVRSQEEEEEEEACGRGDTAVYKKR